VVAAGLSGPRRASAGAARDFVLGAHLIDGNGELLRFGGQVIKNVAGFDVSRLLCGALGTLGLIAQASLKVLPRPRAEITLRFELDAVAALERFNRFRALPLPISATAWHAGIAHVRLSGAAGALRAARETLGGEALDEVQANAFWHSLREHTHAVFRADAPALWRLSLPATAPFEHSGADLIEWSGALRWLRSDAPASTIRGMAETLGGSAMLWRGARGDVSMFHPLARANLELHRRLKRQFDPHRIFNRGRLLEAM
jgi:glycolate oxidase FAD binding subunit